MFWLAVPLDTTPVTYQLVNKDGKQCMYKNAGEGNVGLRACNGQKEEQWYLESGGIRKRDDGTSGTWRRLCAKGTGTNRARIRVLNSCGTGYWSNFDWK